MNANPTRVADLPVFTTRMHPECRERLRAVSHVTGRPIWKLVEEAVAGLSENLNDEDRDLVDRLVERRIDVAKISRETGRWMQDA